MMQMMMMSMFHGNLPSNPSAFIPVTGSTSVNIYNRESHTQTAGQYAVATIFSIDTNKYIFGGDTAP